MKWAANANAPCRAIATHAAGLHITASINKKILQPCLMQMCHGAGNGPAFNNARRIKPSIWLLHIEIAVAFFLSLSRQGKHVMHIRREFFLAQFTFVKATNLAFSAVG